MNNKDLNYYLMYGYLPRQKPMWDINLTSEIKDEQMAKSMITLQLQHTIKSIVEKYPNKKIGILLSGGIDSSIVTAIASKYIKDLNTFSVNFEHNEFDETKYSRMVSKKFKTNHHEFVFSADEVRELLVKMKSSQKLYGGSGVVPLALACERAKEYVDILLTGDGGDELFGGYILYQQYGLLNIQKYYPKFINKMLYPLFNPDKNYNLSTFFELGCLKHRQKYARLMTLLNGKQFKQLTNEDPEEYYDMYAKPFKKGFYLDEAMNMDLNKYLPEYSVGKIEMASSLSGMKIICPLLDPMIIKLACRIDSRLKIKDKEKKYILRKTFEGSVPKEIFSRKKRGFTFPLKRYLLDELWDLVDKYVIDYKSDLNTGFITELLNKKEWGRDYSRLIWAIMVLNMREGLKSN